MSMPLEADAMFAFRRYIRYGAMVDVEERDSY